MAKSSAVLLNCTRLVADVRVLHAAAFAPFVLGLTLLVVAVPLADASGERTEAARFLTVSLVLFATASLIKRGSLIAAFILAACLIVLVTAVLAAVAGERRIADIFVGLLSCILFGVPCWLALRGIAASWRLRKVAWRSHRTGIRSAITELPRDKRLLQALSPLAASLASYALGCLLAIIVALALGRALFGGLALFPFALLGSRLLRRARRKLALHVREVRARDPRRPLLLVRSFADDNLELETRFRYFGRLFSRRLTLEEFVVGQLLTLGPVVAVGKPHEELSPLGAAREYIFGPGWQERVETVLDECSWVVSILGSGSGGLIWEYEQVIRRGMAHRVILVFPPEAPLLIRQRWTSFQAAFPPARGIDLPAAPAVGIPLFAVFPEGEAPTLFCSKYQNETAYSVLLAAVLARLRSRPA